MPPVQREDPYGAFNFLIEVPDVADDGRSVQGSFSEVSGLGMEIAVVEYRNGSEDITPRKLPGLAKYPNVTLKRGITGDLSFWRWILATAQGEIQRRDASIVLLDEKRQPVLRWRLHRAWPCKWTGPGLNASTNEVAMETLELAHEGLRIEGDD
jgi:phage tail-like protein